MLFMPLALSCSHAERVDTTSVKEKMGAFKIKRISEADIIGKMTALSNAVYAAKKLSDCKKGGKLVDSLCNLPELKLERLDLGMHKSVNGKESELFEALKYAMEQDEQVSPMPQKLSEEEYAYYFTIPGSACDSARKKSVWKLTVHKAKLIQNQF